MKDYKNRNRKNPTFANINLQGPCNYQCYFCLGKDIKSSACKNYLQTHFEEWKNFKEYLEKCKNANIQKIYLTGQNTDPLLYRYLEELIEYLKVENFQVGIRTNGLLSLEKIKEINSINEKIGLSIHSLNPDTNEKITGVRTIPDWSRIIDEIQVPIRIAIVVTRYNKDEILDIIQYFSKFEKIKYIQLRCISTDERYEELKEDIGCFKQLSEEIQEQYPVLKEFYTSSIYEIYGKEVSLWQTVKTSINSYNYFTDGIISENYFVVEGYKEQKEKEKVRCIKI